MRVIKRSGSLQACCITSVPYVTYNIRYCYCNVPAHCMARCFTAVPTDSFLSLAGSSLTAPSIVSVGPFVSVRVAARSVPLYSLSPGERGGDEPRQAGAHVHVLRAQHRSRTPVPRTHRHQLHQLLHQGERCCDVSCAVNEAPNPLVFVCNPVTADAKQLPLT